MRTGDTFELGAGKAIVIGKAIHPITRKVECRCVFVGARPPLSVFSVTPQGLSLLPRDLLSAAIAWRILSQECACYARRARIDRNKELHRKMEAKYARRADTLERLFYAGGLFA